MHPFPSPMLISGGALKFIGKVDGNNSSGPATLPAGTKAGDLAVIIANGSAAGITGWDVETKGSNLKVFRKQLTSADLSGVTMSAVSSFGVLVYRGGVRLERRSDGSTVNAPPITIPGFTKAGARGVLTAALTSANMGLTTPSGFNTRHSFVGDGGFRYLWSADVVPASGYTNNANIVWTGSGTSGGDAIAFEII